MSSLLDAINAAARAVSVDAAGRNIAAGAFAQPKPFEGPRLGARHLIDDLINTINAINANLPDGQQVDLTMQTADRRAMIIGDLKPLGFSMFIATGTVEGMECTVIAHVSTINVQCVVVPSKERKVMGFNPTPVTESQP